MTAYYNENDLNAAAWLKELIKADLIESGEVDERGIEDVKSKDLRGFIQCHFFAGIGVWSYALRNAGWPDGARVWTGSCPCQSFSASGKRQGFDDKRHLWPAWFRLIQECRPDVIFGEQVASKDGLAWLDVVSADLEGAGYAIGATDLCVAGLGAPHRRQRLYFVAHTEHTQWRTGNARRNDDLRQEARRLESSGVLREHRETGELGNPDSQRRQQDRRGSSGHEEADGREGRNGSQPNGHHIASGPGEARDMGQPESKRCADNIAGRDRTQKPVESPGFTNGFWKEAEWIYCRDEKYRPVEPGTFPLAHGSPARVGRLRGYGNALCAPAAQAFIEAWLDET